MPYSRDYFALQLVFARRVAKFKHKSLPDTLLSYSSFYKTFRISGWKFKKTDPSWSEFLKVFAHAASNKLQAQVVYDFYLSRLRRNEHETAPKFGCFDYECIPKEKSVYIHFRNTEGAEPGPLSKDRIEVRKAELARMFLTIKRLPREPQIVRGFSWLYNIDAYKRLFPPEFGASCLKVTTWFKSSAIWGQFLDSAGKVKQELTREFLKKVENAQNLQDVFDAFPYLVLEPQLPINKFYSFYGIT